MGRPVALSGGRVDGVPPSPSGATARWVGRIVVGPSGDTVREGAGFATAARLRTTLGAASVGATVAGADAVVGAGAVATSGATVVGSPLSVPVTAPTGDGATSGTGRAPWVSAGDLALLVARPTLGTSSGCTDRRRPSESARRRMRSAWASSMDAEGLVAPMPSF